MQLALHRGRPTETCSGRLSAAPDRAYGRPCTSDGNACRSRTVVLASADPTTTRCAMHRSHADLLSTVSFGWDICSLRPTASSAGPL
jgi:hypothetical protein